jgi:hypothetical protein
MRPIESFRIFPRVSISGSMPGPPIATPPLICVIKPNGRRSRSPAPRLRPYRPFTRTSSTTFDPRREPSQSRTAALASLLHRSHAGIQLVEQAETEHGGTVFDHACRLGLGDAARMGEGSAPVIPLPTIQLGLIQIKTSSIWAARGCSAGFRFLRPHPLPGRPAGASAITAIG